jgi:hypothetical protein
LVQVLPAFRAKTPAIRFAERVDRDFYQGVVPHQRFEVDVCIFRQDQA